MSRELCYKNRFVFSLNVKLPQRRGKALPYRTTLIGLREAKLRERFGEGATEGGTAATRLNIAMIETIEQLSTNKSNSTSTLPSPLRALERISWNYWWSWSRDGAGCFRELAPAIWEECEHNPRLLLSRVSEYRLAEMANDPVYCERVDKLANNFDEYMNLGQAWSNGRQPDSRRNARLHTFVLSLACTIRCRFIRAVWAFSPVII